jgi:predicted metal-dependent hydrolase
VSAHDDAEPRSEPGTVMQGDRRKAYRPIPPDRRRAALEAGLEAYARGNYFEAHELLEPAWMGTSDLAERALYQGLIKVAAGYVHAVRGNPTGLARNLEGARKHLATSEQLDPRWAQGVGIDLAELLAAVDDRLASIRTLAAGVESSPAALLDLAADAPRIRRRA